MSTLQNLDRDKLLAKADALLRKQDFSKQDKAKVDSLLALADSCGGDAMRMKRARVDALELASGNPRSREDVSDAAIESEFRNYLVVGKDAINTEKRDQSVSSGSGGGYLAPASFRDDLEVAVRAYDGLFEAAGQWKSATGNAQVVPLLNDTVSEASIVAENSLESEQDLSTFDGISFAAVPMYRSGIVRVSRELSQDSYFELSAKLADAFGVRFARAIGKVLVTTLTSGADTGVTTAATGAVTASELLDCMSSLDPAYWSAASWCLNKNTLIALLKLGMVSDAAGQAISMWTLGQKFYLFTKPVVVCPSMDDLGASKKPISFGDHSKVVRREVLGSLRVRAYNERYAEYYQYGYSATWRVSAAFMKPSAAGSPAVSQSPCKLVVCHA